MLVDDQDTNVTRDMISCEEGQKLRGIKVDMNFLSLVLY